MAISSRGGLLPVLFFAALAADGCVRSAPPAPPAKGGDGTLRVALAGEPTSLNPNIGPDEFAMIAGENLFNKLVSLTPDGTLLPELAERWEESADGLTYTFHLRPGVRWHDGRPLTADDVRETFLRAREESSNRDLAARIAGADVVGERAVAIRLTAPWAAFIPAVGWYGAAIMPAHVYQSGRWKGHPANERPVGTGPFRLKRWDRGRRLVLEKNPHYFGAGPFVDEVEFVTAPSVNAAVDLVVQGGAHVLVGRPPSTAVPALSRMNGLRVITSPGDGRTYLGFNMRRPPFDDLRARRAVNLALDRHAIVDRALAGVGTPAVGFYTPAVGWAYNPAARVPERDPGEARRLLAGTLPRGYAPLLVCPAAMSGLAEELVRQLAPLGLRVRVAALPMPEYFARVLETRDFDLAIMSGSQGPDPDSLSTRFASDGWAQFMGYSSASLDAALAAGARHSDAARRAPAYFRAQEILAADLPIAPLTESVRVLLFRDGVRGLPQHDARSLAPDYSYRLVRLGARPER